jgi:hypothetical protein
MYVREGRQALKAAPTTLDRSVRSSSRSIRNSSPRWCIRITWISPPSVTVVTDG